MTAVWISGDVKQLAAFVAQGDKMRVGDKGLISNRPQTRMQRYGTMEAGLAILEKKPARRSSGGTRSLSATAEGRHMDRTPVHSSNIRSVGYDLASQTLEVEFHNGGLYQYYGVPETIYQGFMQAASKGSFFNNHIKDRYRYRRLRQGT